MIDRTWLHEHLGVVFRAKHSGTLWMLVSITNEGLLRFRTQNSPHALVCTEKDFENAMNKQDFEETNEVWA